MKKITLSLTTKSFISLFILSLFSTFASAQETTKMETGFYMNDGCTKVESITCYGFKGFCYIHEVTNVMLAYDRITYQFGIAAPAINVIEDDWSKKIEGRIFSSVVSGKSMIKIPLLSRVDNNENTKNMKTLENSYYIINMYGEIISSYEEKYSESSRSYIRTPIYKSTLIFQAKIPLENRKFLQTKTAKKIPILSGFVKDTPYPDAIISEDCYPCVGEKPEIFEFKPFNY